MGRCRRTPHDPKCDDVGGFPLRYLLPIKAQSTNDEENAVPKVVFQDDHKVDELDELNLYRQAVPLLHPQSTAAARTIGKILGDTKFASRILQRNQPGNDEGIASPSMPNAVRRHQFHKTCEDMFYGFDPSTKKSKQLPMHRVRLLLHFYGLDIDEVLYRQWEQGLPANCAHINVVDFIHGCTQWFQEQVLITHYEEWRQRRAATGLVQSAALGKCQSAPQLLHPFDELARQNDDAQSFPYEDYARSPPRQYKTQEEECVSKSQALISATQQLRRNKKMLTRLNSSPAISIDPQVSSAYMATHDRLHGEKLARHILQRCGSQALAPSNRRKSSASMTLVASAGSPLNAHGKKVRQEAAKKLARQQNNETAKAFSASIAMISRHVHNEELRDLREVAYEKQLAIVDERKQLRRLQQAHCKALAQEKTHQQIRDVIAMKTMAQEETEMTRQYLLSRQQLLRHEKPQFTLSSSTSTLFQQPPEILAAKATAKTNAQKKRLQQMEREHLDHMRSIQLIDYAYDKKRAVEDANEPKADAVLVDLQVENLPRAQEMALATQELWGSIVQSCQENGDLTPLIPPPNSPPAALRYFGSVRPTSFLPPFTASTVTHTPVSKVP